MGFGQYGKAEELDWFRAMFNTDRLYLPHHFVDTTHPEKDFVKLQIGSAQSAYKWTLIVVAILASYFMLLLTWLVIVQTQNVFTGTTTF